jgi:hypothetical protein
VIFFQSRRRKKECLLLFSALKIHVDCNERTLLPKSWSLTGGYRDRDIYSIWDRVVEYIPQSGTKNLASVRWTQGEVKVNSGIASHHVFLWT